MLLQRIITAVVLAPIMLMGVFWLPLDYFALFIGFIVLLGAWEWSNLAGLKSLFSKSLYSGLILLVGALGYWYQSLLVPILILGVVWWSVAFWLVKSYPNTTRFWDNGFFRLLMGFFVLVPMWAGLFLLKAMPNSSLLILLLMLLVWGADVGAYFAGRAFGKRKLAPNVSPGKTWAGVIGGVITCYLIATVAAFYLPGMNSHQPSEWVFLFLMVTLVVMISVLGDLLESMLKRCRGIKDSSNLLPGHGGVMDRIDSMSAAVPLYALALSLGPLV